MSFRVKSAAVAALAACSIAATVASGVSLADDSIPSITPLPGVAVSSSSSAQADISGKVRFAPYKEVVQPIGRASLNSDDNLASVPDSDAILAVPDRNYTSLAAMVRDVDTSVPLDAEANCLATAVFYEARSESLEGQLAVARVIVNRARSSRFGDSLCGVILQPRQFSFVRRGVLPKANVKRPAWKTAIAIARIAMDNAWESRAEGALFFHARRVSPSWGRPRIAAIDNHIFYR